MVQIPIVIVTEPRGRGRSGDAPRQGMLALEKRPELVRKIERITAPALAERLDRTFHDRVRNEPNFRRVWLQRAG